MGFSLNYFADPTAAERYAVGRPYFHPIVVDRIGAVCGAVGQVGTALDIGCGTGQSTLALAERMTRVLGTDVSQSMLEHCHPHERIRYVRGSAEDLPFLSNSFELVTAGLAFHWFDRPRFLAEAGRVLKANGWLAIYDDGMTGEMVGNEEYVIWIREHYMQKYPAPPRNSASLTDRDTLRSGFIRKSREQFTHDVEFTSQQLVKFLLSQTNIIEAVERHKANVGRISDWLESSVESFFSAYTALFRFRCVLDIFQRRTSA